MIGETVGSLNRSVDSIIDGPSIYGWTMREDRIPGSPFLPGPIRLLRPLIKHFAQVTPSPSLKNA